MIRVSTLPPAYAGDAPAWAYLRGGLAADHRARLAPRAALRGEAPRLAEHEEVLLAVQLVPGIDERYGRFHLEAGGEVDQVVRVFVVVVVYCR